MNTKDRIIHTSLSLFSVKGYNNTSVRDITGGINMRESAIYKHFTNKQAVFDAIVELAAQRIQNLQQELTAKYDQIFESSETKIPISTIQQIYCELFTVYLTDDVLSKFRRMMTIEQYRNKELNTMFKEMFIDKTLNYLTKVFRQLIQGELIQNSDLQTPEVLALQFYSPIFMLFYKYDFNTEALEQAIEQIKQHISVFFNLNLEKKDYENA